ncbi:MAG: hypothetical protein IT318_15360 [Anaerolineales bacterium]|nr:hypothetical protein [Anaerolineales bacterium]
MKRLILQVSRLAFRLLAALILLIFALATPAWLLARSLASTLTDPTPYHQLLAERQLEQPFQGDVMALYLNYILLHSPIPRPAGLVQLTPVEARAMAQVLLPPEWLAAQASALLDAGFAWLTGGDPLPTVTFDLAPLRARVEAPEAALALLPLLEGAPACPTAHAAAAANTVFAECLPAGANVQALAERTARVLASSAPPEASFAGLLSSGLIGLEVVRVMDQARYAWRWLQAALLVAGWACLTLLALYLLLAARGLAGLTGALGRALGIAGVVCLALAGALYGLAVRIGTGQTTFFEALFRPDAADLIGELAALGARAAAPTLLAWGGGLAAAGLAVWIAARLLARRAPAAKAPPRRQTRVRRQFV